MDAAEVARLTRLEHSHWWYSERRTLLAGIVRQIPRVGTAVDIGAAGGGNTEVLHRLGWTTVALEMDAGAAVVARSRSMSVVRADAHRLPVRSASVQLVTAFDILEHLGDDRRAAREIHRILAPGGRVIIAVPADPRLWSRHDEAVGHQRRYTRRTLLDTLTGAGLAVDRLWSWNVLLRPAIAWRRKSAEGSDLAETPALMNAILRGVVACERVLPVGRLPGVTLMLTAHRPL